MSSYDEEALNYLRVKFPDADEQAFFTDYTGTVHDDVIDALSVIRAMRIEHACETCRGKCKLTDRRSKPVVFMREHPKGFKFLSVMWTCGISCKYEPLSGEFGVMFSRSGLSESQLNRTFENYQIQSADAIRAKAEAKKASDKQSGLILAGMRGTGKTHLAIAIALNAMHHGRQAIFRLVNELLDEIRQSVKENADYYGLIRRFKEVPCLILDDLGKEKQTEAGLDYLYQIVDYRYRNGLQTIITTNARTIEELSSWCEEQYITPMVSRVMENGAWVTLEEAEDYRVKTR